MTIPNLHHYDSHGGDTIWARVSYDLVKSGSVLFLARGTPESGISTEIRFSLKRGSM